jgi:hypothetical protein
MKESACNSVRITVSEFAPEGNGKTNKSFGGDDQRGICLFGVSK